MAQKIKVIQTKSMICQTQKTRKILRGLGLRRIGAERVHTDNNCIRGMVNKVKHLISYEIIKG
ncbi:MAG: 50S ribosomal protein L30 [Bdellovibrionota bacterium]